MNLKNAKELKKFSTRPGFELICEAVTEERIAQMKVLADYNYPPLDVLLKSGFTSKEQSIVAGAVVGLVMKNEGYKIVGRQSNVVSGRRITRSLYEKETK